MILLYSISVSLRTAGTKRLSILCSNYFEKRSIFLYSSFSLKALPKFNYSKEQGDFKFLIVRITYFSRHNEQQNCNMQHLFLFERAWNPGQGLKSLAMLRCNPHITKQQPRLFSLSTLKIWDLLTVGLM